VPEPIRNMQVRPGSQVEVELFSRSGPPERLTFTLVDDSQADFDAGFLGLSTPLAKTILGKLTGQTLSYRVGDLQSVKILSVQPQGQKQTEDVAARRQAVIDKAVKHSDSVNAMIFSGAVNSKWGDYDFDKLDKSQWGKDDDSDEQKGKSTEDQRDKGTKD